jgi:hypothetical protein
MSEQENWDDVLPTREVEQEKLDILDGKKVVMTPELERLLDEGLENLEQAKTTDELSN